MTDLIARLRDTARYFVPPNELMYEAADALEAAQTREDMLQAELTGACERITELEERVVKLALDAQAWKRRCVNYYGSNEQ